MLAQAVEHLIKNIVDFPDDISVKSHENARGELIRVRVNPEDIGRVIGRSGRTANAIRTVVQALADHKVRVDIMDVRRSDPSVVRDMHSDDPQQPELLRVCRIGRAQGLKGEVTVQIFTDEPEYRFAPGAVLYTKDGEEEYVVENSRTFKNRWIVKFEGIDNRDQSEAANGIVLYGEADDPEDMLEADEWYPKDLIGLEARLAENNMLGLEPGVVVGKVVDVIEVAQWLLKIRLANPVKDADGVVVENSALVPFVDELVPDIDLEEGYLTLDPPGGLIPGL